MLVHGVWLSSNGTQSPIVTVYKGSIEVGWLAMHPLISPPSSVPGDPLIYTYINFEVKSVIETSLAIIILLFH